MTHHNAANRLALILLLGIALCAFACGKKGPPKPYASQQVPVHKAAIHG